MAEPTPSRFRRRFFISTNVLLQCLAVLALMIMVNWLVSRHYVRYDWTNSGYFKLADKTKQVLKTLKEPLKVIVYLQPNASDETTERLFDDVRSLLKEFKYYGKDKLAIEYVDPYSNLARAKQIVEEYKIDAPREPALVIFVSGARHKYVGKEDMVTVESNPYANEPPHITSFKAEGAFLSAIQTVTEEAPAAVYFLTGHGERDPENFDQQNGYSTLAAYIKRDNIVVQKWNLQEQQSFPTNADALVIAGPHKKFSELEQTALEQYLKNRGRLYIMLDPKSDSGLEAFLKRWGVQVDNDLVMRKAGALLGTELIDVNALATSYAHHPVTEHLVDVNTEFPYARSVRRLQPAPGGADQPRVTELAMTSKDFWGSTSPDEENVRYNQGTDLPGPLSLAVAVESGQPRDVNVDLGVSRMIVVGTSGFVDNNSLTSANLDFFMSGLNWLLKREQLLAVGPKVPEEFRLNMTASQVNAVYALVMVGLPLGVGMVGLLVWLRRRK